MGKLFKRISTFLCKGNLIYTLKGYDPDNDTLTFDKRATPDSGVIRIENNGTTEALVYLAKELDREVLSSHIHKQIIGNAHLSFAFPDAR